jgi:hypothetical protein
MVSKRATTSGFAYCVLPISYRSWAVTVPTETWPSVPSCAVGIHLGDREAGALDGRDLLEEGVVPARALRAALDDVTCHHGGRQLVPVVARPAELPGGRSDDHGRVGDARTDHEIRSAVQRLDDAEAAQVGVRAQDLLLEIGQRNPLVEVRERLALVLELLQSGQQVVPLDVGDRRLDAGLAVHALTTILMSRSLQLFATSSSWRRKVRA